MENTIQKKTPRMLEQDIAKGICIFLVIGCHTLPLTVRADQIIRALLGFAMPFFFFISGYNYRPGRGTYGQLVKKRAKLILKTAFIFSLVISVGFTIGVLIARGTENCLQMVKAFLGFWISEPIASKLGLHSVGSFVGMERVFEPNWFLIYMFSAYVVFLAVADYALKSSKRFFSVSALLVIVSSAFDYFGILLPWGFHDAPAIAALMLAGSMAYQHNLFTEPAPTSKWNIINSLVAAAITIVFGLAFPRACQITGSGKMASVIGTMEIPLTVIYGFISAFYLINLSRIIAKIPYVSKFFAWFGVNSMTILLIHLLCMGAGKLIVGAPLNMTLDKMATTWTDVAGFIVTLILVSLVLILIEKISKKKKKA